MKKITNDEYSSLAKSKGNQVIDFIVKLGIQESCQIEESEWPYKSNPQMILTNRFLDKGMKFECMRMQDRGWIVKRVA